MAPSKVQDISRACWLADSIFSRLVKKMCFFGTEREVALFLKKEIRKMGFGLAFEPIVGSVPGGAQPHHKPENTALKRGFCVIDFGVRVNGCPNDMTRTVFFGKPKKSELKLYNLVLSSQKKAVKKLRVGVSGHSLWSTSSIALKNRSKNFTHGLGHGIGNHIHKKPFLKKGSEDVLSAGDIVTVEPGIYFKNRFGIRVEDDFLITKTGAKKLSKSTNKLLSFPVPRQGIKYGKLL